MNEFELIKKADVMRIINAENAVVLNNRKERSTDEVLCAIASQINGLQTTAKYATDSTDSAKFCDCCDWIPCSERLPDNGIAVLVWTGENNFKVWLAEYSKYMETWTLAGNYVPLRKNAVIAWMPFPEPPEEVQE